VHPLAVGVDPGSLPRFTPDRLFTESGVDPFLATVLVVAAGLYLWGVRQLAARGDRWSPWRTASWLAGGLGTVAFATMSGLGAYDETLFSVHMVQHMILSMVSPIFLALGAPVTLALRTLPLRERRVLLSVVHSRVARVLTFPLVGWVLFVGSPFALYFSAWYPATLRHAWMHEMLHVHLVLVGCLFFWPLLGLDPIPGRVSHPFRALMLFAALPFHAILGLSVMLQTSLIAGDYYRELARPWGPSLSADQYAGGGVLWATGDLVGLLFFGTMFFQWQRAETRAALQVDRKLDREERRAAVAVPASDGSAAHSDPPLLEKPWWEVDAGPLAERFRRESGHRD
jgi:putative membrane protein